jgi:hypothetical protein
MDTYVFDPATEELDQSRRFADEVVVADGNIYPENAATVAGEGVAGTPQPPFLTALVGGG